MYHQKNEWIMKTTYQKPTIKVVKIQQQYMLCLSNKGVQSITNDDDFQFIGEGLNDVDV